MILLTKIARHLLSMITTASRKKMADAVYKSAKETIKGLM